MTLGIVSLPVEYFPDPNKGRPIFNGQIFVGEPDTDPEILINRKDIVARQENGTDVPISPAQQPVLTSSGGVPTYNGATVQILVEGNYSIKVLDKQGAQEYYFPNFNQGRPIVVGDDHNLLGGRGDVGAHDGIYRRATTVAEVESGVFIPTVEIPVIYLFLTDRDNGRYDLSAGGTPDGFAVLDAGAGNTATIVYEDYVIVDQVGAGGTSDDAPAIESAINTGSQLKGTEGTTYTFDSTITTSNPVSFDLNGGILKSTINNSITPGAYYPTLMFDVTDSDKFEIFNGGVNGGANGLGNALATDELEDTSPLFVVRDSKNIRFESLDVRDYESSVFSGGGGGDNGLFGDNTRGWAIFKGLRNSNVKFVLNDFTDTREEGIFNAYSDHITFDFNIWQSTQVAMITAFHAWYCTKVSVQNNDIDLDINSGASTLNIYSRRVTVKDNEIVGGSGLDLGNEHGDVFTARHITVRDNVMLDTKIKLDIGEQTIVENISILRNDIESSLTGINCIFFAGLIRGGRVENNNLTAAGGTSPITIRLSSFVNGGGLQPQALSRDISILDNIIVGNGIASLAIGIDVGRTSRFKGMTIKGNRISDCWIGIFSRDIFRKASFIDMEISHNFVDIDPSIADSTLGYGSGLFLTTDTDIGDVTPDFMAFENITVKDNEFHTSVIGIRILLNTDPAKPDHSVAERITINDNLCYGNSAIESYAGIRHQGQDGNFTKNVNINRNTIDAQVTALGTNINLKSIEGTFVSGNTFGPAIYHISISTELSGTLRVEDNVSNSTAGYRYTAGYVDSTTKKYINRNGLYVASGGFNATDFGNTANRPTVAVSDVYIGYQYFDITTGGPVFWDGAAWV